MTVIIKNLLKDELNRCIVISGDNDYIKEKDALEERNGNSSWYLVVVLDGGKYLVTKFENLDVQVLGSGAEILDRPLKLLGKPLVSAPVFKQSTSIKKISNAINKNSAPVAVIAYKGAVAGIISEDSLKESLGMNSFEQGGDKWIKEKLLWLKENPWRALSYIFFSLIPIIIGYIAFWQSIKPERLVMTGEWNIAVARFIELGEPNINDEVRLISDVFANRLESEMSEFQEQIDVVVQVMKPEQLGAIDGLTTEERFLRAESLAERINADVVVYGVIERNGDALYLTPEFYVGIENFYEAEEMVGQYVLGESILILEVFDNLPSQIRLYRGLTNRSQILAFITRGLTYYFIHACSHAGWSDNVSV